MNNLPMEDGYDEMRRPRSKQYMATARALRMNYDILTEYQTLLEIPEGLELKDPDIRALFKGMNRVEIKKEVELIVSDIKALEDTITKLMPKGDTLFSKLFWYDNSGILVSRGIINGLGRPYASEEELCEDAGSEQERKALILGNIKLHGEPRPLVVEVYAHVVNVVHMDGSVQVFEL